MTQTQVFLPVMDATRVKLELVVIPQEALLHMVEVDWLAVDEQEAHAALEHVKGVCTLLTTLLCWATCKEEYMTAVIKQSKGRSHPKEGSLKRRPHKHSIACSQ